jgi:predicted dehydrogenase
MTKKLGYAVLGLGIGMAHAEAAAASEYADLVAVCDIDEKRLAKAASLYEGITLYREFEELLKDDRVDIISVCLPSAMHTDFAVRAMEAGKHVLVEKPAALSAAEFDEMCACAKANNVVLIEAMRPAHDAVLPDIREAMTKIGPIRRAVLEFCQYSSRYDKFRAGEVMNAFNPALGNAAVMDIGVYALEVCVLLFGSPKEIISRSVILENGFEGMGTVFLDYGTYQVDVAYSKITDSVIPSVITGEDGSLKLGKLSTFDSLTLCLRKQEPEVIFEGREDGGAGNMVYEVADFVKMIHGDMDAAPYQEVTRETLRIIDEVRKQSGIEFN